MTTALPQEREKQLNIETVELGGLTWINIQKPTAREIDYLQQHFPFHPLDLEDCLKRVQRPKIDEYDEYLFIVVHFPVYNRTTRVTTPSEIDIFVGPNYLITLHAGDLRPITNTVKECKGNGELAARLAGRSSGFLLYLILDRLVDYCFPILNRVYDNIEQVEDQVFVGQMLAAVAEISIIRRDIIALRRIVRPQMGVLSALARVERPFLRDELEIYFDSVADHIRQIWDTLNDYKEVIDTVNDTNNSLISSRINNVIRVLTIISTIMLPLTVVASIYGMNIEGLPLATTPWALPLTISVMAAIAGGMLTFFYLKRWL